MIAMTDVAKSLALIEKMTAGELRKKYAELFGDESRSGNRQWLKRRCAWRVQALAEGDLSERARRRAKELVREYDTRQLPPAEMKSLPAAPTAPGITARQYIRPPRDARLPMPGTKLTKTYKDHLYVVEVLDRGFGYEGEIYRSLSAVAHVITGNHWNGYLFFGIADPRKEPT